MSTEFPPGLPDDAAPLSASRIWDFESPIPDQLLTTNGSLEDWTIRPEGPFSPLAICHAGQTHSDEKGRRLRGNFLAPADAFYRDFEVSTYVMLLTDSPDGGGGVAFRIRSGVSFYLAELTRDSVRLVRSGPDGFEVLKSTRRDVESETWYALSASAVGARIRVALDNQELFEVTDPEHDWGRIGVWSGVGTSACFDDLAAGPDVSLPT